MTMLNNKRDLEGQALAIVLIILVVGVIIALAVVSRSQKNQLRLVEEKRSQEAIEVSNSLINVSQSLATSEIQTNCATLFANNEECCITSDELNHKFTGFSSSFDYPKCSEQSGGESNSDVKVCFKLEKNLDGYQIPKDQVLAIPFLSGNYASGCMMNLKVTSNGGTGAGVVVSRYAVQKSAASGYQPTSYKPFAGTDIRGYSFGGTADWSNWETYNSNGIDVSIAPEVFGGSTYLIHEIRVRAVGGPVTVQATPSCEIDAIAMRITSSAVCSSSFRSEWYYRPIRESASSLFDYVLYNAKGDLKYQE